MKEKNLSKKNLTSNIQPLTASRGITLIALVITIIVMLILVSVTISIAINGGLFEYAGKAVKGTKSAINSEQQFIDQIVLGDYERNYSQEKAVNKPKLAEGMIPIKYNGTNWEICSEDDKDWYDYREGKMQWANVMLSDGTYKTTDNTAEVGTKVKDEDLGSMFVWIPRYAYSINEYGVAKDGEGTTQNITNVTFLVGTTNKDITGKEYELDYSTEEVEKAKKEADEKGETVSTPKIVHPGFNFGGKSLSGLWVAKFEASMKGQEQTNTITDDRIDKNLSVLPNVQSWRYISVGNAFTNCLKMNKNKELYGITSTVDSHLMKNSEWGAVAYLATSQYGITPTLNSYGSYITGGNDYKNKKIQGTTGNVTGVYDMCGGAWEYVAAYYDNGNGSLGTYGATYFSKNKLDPEYEKYWNRYEVNEDEKKADLSIMDNEKIKDLAEKRLNLMKDVKGVGMYDVKNTFSFYVKKNGSGTWMTDEENTGKGICIYNNDYTLVGNSSLPFLLRGGRLGDKTGAGVFASNGGYGYAIDAERISSCACSILEIRG